MFDSMLVKEYNGYKYMLSMIKSTLHHIKVLHKIIKRRSHDHCSRTQLYNEFHMQFTLKVMDPGMLQCTLHNMRHLAKSSTHYQMCTIRNIVVTLILL